MTMSEDESLYLRPEYGYYSVSGSWSLISKVDSVLQYQKEVAQDGVEYLRDRHTTVWLGFLSTVEKFSLF
jgi:hypothetical protein